MSTRMEHIKQQLKGFPSLFDFKKEGLIRQNRVKILIVKLNEDDEAFQKSTEVKIKLYNFISYLYYLDVNFEEAFKFADESLKLDPENLCANVAKCHFFLEVGQFANAKKTIDFILELRNKKNFRQKRLDAKAGLAYAYARSGPFYHGDAEQIYRQIISECPTNYQWKFGLGLALVRQTHIVNSVKKNIFSHRNTMLVEALDLFLEVAENTDNEDDTQCAKAWVEIGIILYNNERQVDGRRIYLPRALKSHNAKGCFKKALLKCQSDAFVLGKCGQYFRYFGGIEKSEDLLRKAKCILDDCFVNHHLALTLQQKAFRNSTSHTVPKMHARDNSKVYIQNPRKKFKHSEHQSLFQTDFTSSRLPTKTYSDIETGEASASSFGERVEVPSSPDTGNHGLGSKLPKNQISVKSPRQLKTYPNNPILREAEGYLRKAAEMSDGETILYDLALLYRYLGQPHDALVTLNKITDLKERCQSTVNVINVYEQKAMCYLDVRELSQDSQEQKNNTKNAESYLYKAIELQVVLVKEEQECTSAWNTTPTLRSLLERNPGTSFPRRLAKAHQMMDDFDETIKLWELLQEKSQSTLSDHGHLIKRYVHDGDFEKASVLLNLLQCTGQFIDFDRSVAVGSSIKCALHSVEEGDAPIAVSRFRSAYKCARHIFGRKESVTSHSLTGTKSDSNELHILHKSKKAGDSLQYEKFITLLKNYTDLKITAMTEDATGSSIFSTASRENTVIFSDMGPKELVASELKAYFAKLRTTGGKVIVVIAENQRGISILESLNIAVVRFPAKMNYTNRMGNFADIEKQHEITILKRFFEKLCEIDLNL